MTTEHRAPGTGLVAVGTHDPPVGRSPLSMPYPLMEPTTNKALTATYRLQLHKDFPFSSARAILPYLRRLGVSHVYTSPVLSASPGSKHGYDVTDTTTVNPELGGEVERKAFVHALRREGLGWMLDIVPNHMGTGATNWFWEDLLASGQRSPYARWFDIDWDAPESWLRGRVMLPVLEDELESVLARAEISVVHEGGKPRIRYGTRTLPLSVESLEKLEESDDSIAGEARGSRPVGREEPDSFSGGGPPHWEIEPFTPPSPARRPALRPCSLAPSFSGSQLPPFFRH